MIACKPRRWTIDGPRLLPSEQFHVVALEQGCMIGMIDGKLSENHVVVNMIYVSPPWRGSLVLRDMLAALKLTGRHVAVSGRQHGGRRRRHDAMRK
jgi:hypothetical protein